LCAAQGGAQLMAENLKLGLSGVFGKNIKKGMIE